MAKLENTLHLKGIRDITASSQSKVWLNHKLLKLEKSLKVKSHSLLGFDWGNERKGASQLALAICLEVYPQDIALQVYQAFKEEFLATIQDNSFSLNIDLSAFNEIHVKLMMVAED